MELGRIVSAVARSYGLLKDYEERKTSPAQTLLRVENTYATDAYTRPYVGSALTKLDPGTAHEKVSKVEEVVDALGGLAERRIYDYEDLTAPARTYRNYFVNAGGGWLATKSEVVEGGQTLVLGEWKYDGAEGSACAGLSGFTPYSVADASGMTYHDAGYGTSVTARGLVTWSKALGKPAGCVRYDIGGNVVKSGVVGGGTEQYTVTGASQHAGRSR